MEDYPRTKKSSFTQMKATFFSLSEEVFSAFHSIVFLGYFSVGVCIAALTWFHSNIALFGLIGLFTGLILMQFMKVSKFYPQRGTVLFNSLLVGLYCGFLFFLHWESVVLTILAVCVTVVLTIFLGSVFSLASLPVLSFPFTIVGGFLAFSAPKMTNLMDASYYFRETPLFFQSWIGLDLPPWIHEGLKSMGALFCIPDWFFGAGVLLCVLVYSPLTAIFMVSGLFLGIAGENFLAFSPYQVPMDHHFFNYALIFTAFAGTFLIPSRFSLFFAALGTFSAVLITTASATFWGSFGVPVLALPFNLTVHLILRTLKTLGSWQLNVPGGKSPESALDRARLLWLRHRAGELGVACPFEGDWVVQQGFGGPWTHRGNWQHALDFVKQGENGKTFKSHGAELEDYFAFGQNVLSPIEGYVVALNSQSPDNPIGKVENQKNWGNFVTIRSLAGAIVTLAHLKKSSVGVTLGEYVFVGKKIGLCGNSGYSQEPHIHLQAQLSVEMGAYTHAFHLVNYYTKKKVRSKESLIFHGVPKEKEVISPLSLNLALDRLLTFRVGDVQIWQLDNGEKLKFEHVLDPATGIPYWTDGSAKLFYSRVGAQFYFHGFEGSVHSPLADWLKAGPRIPMSFGKKAFFRDFLPLSMTHHGVRRFFLNFSQLLFSKLFGAQAIYQGSESGLELRGRVLLGSSRKVRTLLKLDPVHGPVLFQVGSRTFRREVVSPVKAVEVSRRVA